MRLCSALVQKEILLSDVVVCSVAYILTFAVTASTVFLSLKVIGSSFVAPVRTAAVVDGELFAVPAALCHHRAVRAGGDGGLRHPLPDPSAEEASPLAVDLSSGPEDQGVPSV